MIIKHISQKLSTLCLLGCALLLQACASTVGAPMQTFDLGSLPTGAAEKNIALSISLAEINAPITLDGNAMLYRLHYENEQQLRPYAQSRWSMPPAQLLGQRIKSTIAAHHGTVMSSGDGVFDFPIVKIDLDEFSQIFTSTNQSHANIAMRASVIIKNKLLAQRSFMVTQVSHTADAKGGAKAMQLAADQITNELLTWLPVVVSQRSF